ncbi:MAG: RNA pseudouridine synthase [Puniceicoccales bacterium]|nr:RNA pseudouridine synthase [Puniceicoccales bacterium]
MNSLDGKISHLTTILAHGVKLIQFDANGLVALDKPIGIMAHPNDKSIKKKEEEKKISLLAAPYNAKLKKYSLGNGLDFFLLNRLDSPTSGVIIGCFDHGLAEAVITSFSLNRVHKKYIALTKFSPCPKQGHWENFLQKTIVNNKLRLIKTTGEKCLTDYKILKIIDAQRLTLALLALKPITGKTHQLRIQCAMHNLPILGDKTYGDFRLNRLFAKTNQPRMCLHSESMEIAYNLQNKEYKFYATSHCPFQNTENIELI